MPLNCWWEYCQWHYSLDWPVLIVGLFSAVWLLRLPLRILFYLSVPSIISCGFILFSAYLGDKYGLKRIGLWGCLLSFFGYAFFNNATSLFSTELVKNATQVQD